MNLFDIILLAIALAMDCFTVSIVSGVLMGNQRDRSRDSLHRRDHGPVPLIPPFVSMALLFGFFQAMMPLIGWLGISYFSHYLEAVDHWIAFALLAFIGGKMIKESFETEEEQHFDPTKFTTQIILAIATSIDALAVGISFACTGYDRLSQLTLPLVIIGLVSFLFSIIGYHLGHRFGKAIARRLRPELFGGIILVLIGIKILITHLM